MSSVLSRSVAILIEHRTQESDRYVDLAVSLRVTDVDRSGPRPKFRPETDEVLAEVGGRWDRRAKRWTSEDARRVVILRVPRGSDQEAPARWLAKWLTLYNEGERGPHWDAAEAEAAFRRVYTLMLVGGRRAGKSHLATALLVIFAVMVPDSIVWAISPTQDRGDEVLSALKAMMARSWYRYRESSTNKTITFALANGSRIRCISGHKPRGLKQGRCDLALYNEAQDMHRAGWRQLRGAIADRGGLVVLSCNPPEAEIGRWVEEVWEKARAKKIAAEVFSLTARSNPFADFRVLAAMEAEETDEKAFRREVLGEFVPIGDVTFHAWSDSESVLTSIPPDWTDITHEVTLAAFRRPFDAVAGMDFQQSPHMVGILRRYFRSPAFPEDVIEVIVDEVVVEEANEDDLVDALEGRRPEVLEGRWERDERVMGEGYNPERTAVVMDASGWFQDGKHSLGKTSDEALRRRRWVWLFKPQRESDRNPDIVERAKVVNARLKNAAGRRRLFVLAHCLRTIRAMRSLELVNGVPKKRSPFAHVCDGVGYATYRLFARPAVVKRPVTYDRVRLTRADEMRGI